MITRRPDRGEWLFLATYVALSIYFTYPLLVSGGRLGISTRTVESHLRRLFDRYGVVSRAELAVLAISEGWVEAGR